jgi:hypothetical protein
LGPQVFRGGQDNTDFPDHGCHVFEHPRLRRRSVYLALLGPLLSE